MREIWQELGWYFRETDKRNLALSALVTGVLVGLNYAYNLDQRIGLLPLSAQYACWYLLFLFAFSVPYILMLPLQHKNLFSNNRFLLLLLLAPVLFAWKMAAPVAFEFSSVGVVNNYWNRVVYFPAKLLVITAGLFFIWRSFDRDQPFYGTSLARFRPRPYLIMLAIMVPLIAAAATQPDFLYMYPKLKSVQNFLNQHPSAFYTLLFELSYGIDFVGIELFFRGFLVLAFIKWAGKDAILPMACFYCTIHFGKPLAECISSFFGGLILGVVTYHTRTILGGLMVHLGIAWLMELGGYLGNKFLQ